ncbi:MAG: aconitase X catalytic domain-containing protein [Thermofilaceae archaeon]
MVELTRDEERILSGEKGEWLAKAMQTVVKVAEVLEADRLVKISSAHISGISYKNLGLEGVEFIEKISGNGLGFSVTTTLNPAGFDIINYRDMGVSDEIYSLQLRVLKAFKRMGARVTLTCTPYLYSPPRFGEHLAWAESNAVLYANSMLGARTNREGGPLALLEAIVGRAPHTGLHTTEGRLPTISVDLSEVKREVERRGWYSLLGYVIGDLIKSGVPVLLNPPVGLREPKLQRLFLSAVGASSSVGLLLIEGVSPEFKPSREVEAIRLGVKDLQEAASKWNVEESDAIVLGCPHLSPSELTELYTRIKGRRVKCQAIFFTSRSCISKVPWVVQKLRESGIKIYADTCMVVCDLRRMGIFSCSTDSAKAAYYLSSQGYSVSLIPREVLIDNILS